MAVFVLTTRGHHLPQTSSVFSPVTTLMSLNCLLRCQKRRWLRVMTMQILAHPCSSTLPSPEAQVHAQVLDVLAACKAVVHARHACVDTLEQQQVARHVTVASRRLHLGNVCHNVSLLVASAASCPIAVHRVSLALMIPIMAAVSARRVPSPIAPGWLATTMESVTRVSRV